MDEQMRSRIRYLLLTGTFVITAITAQTDNHCSFQFPFAGIKVKDVYNGPIICRGVTTANLKANSNVHLIDSTITKSLFVRGSLTLYHSQVSFVDVFGDIQGQDCKLDGTVNLYGNSMHLENCTAENINIYYGGISAFPPHLTLYKSKVLGTIKFFHRQGYVSIGHDSSVNKIINGKEKTNQPSAPIHKSEIAQHN
jgi:hypothetical protein